MYTSLSRTIHSRSHTPHRLPDRLDLPLRYSPFFTSSLRAVPESSAGLSVARDRKLDYSSLQPTLQSSTDKLSSYNPASHSSTKSPLFSTEFHYKTFPVAYHS
ncbi:hypothetical protein H9L39_10225 [Fusarium oxysporum f. sp. albedinis]|nr:hypothetical protein H9L39_10225 [Fusarium oxysporum f. sp. albedinis]